MSTARRRLSWPSPRTVSEPRSVRRLSLAIIALIAYVPALLTKPGRMPSDTKLYLYLDPARLVTDAPFTWDTRQFGGWVPHQTIAYLWPQGPWYWLFDRLGVPDWVAHRLWIGTLLFLGAWGVMWMARQLGLGVVSALTAGVVYQVSPYILPYVSRTSAMLLPWAALGWIIGLTIRAATDSAPSRLARWRYPALMALVLVSCSAVNATAILMVAPAPVLWLVHAVVQRTITWRRAVACSLRIAVLGIAVSLWWIVMLRAQGKYGADVLAYSESLRATSLTSSSIETMRGTGYWLFYIRDPYAFTTTASQPYMESVLLILVSYALVLVGMIGIAVSRWSQRRFAALLVLGGIVLAVGVHPFDAPSPLMAPIRDTGLGLALRSSTRALPMSVLGLALGAGALVAAVRSLPARTPRRRWVQVLAPAFVIALALVNLPALFDGGLVDPALERDEHPPAAWQDAAAELSAGSSEYRVLQLPGAEFGAFRWGYTVDPPLPGMTTKPLVTRDLLPLGSPGVMDLLFALDDRVQQGTLDAAALAPVARMLGVDTVWVANDIAFDRFRSPRPTTFAEWIASVDGLSDAQSFGDAEVNVTDIPMLDEHALTTDDAALAPVQLYGVDDAVAIVRTADRAVILVGSGDGIIDAAAAGLLDGDEAVLLDGDRSRLAADGADALRTGGTSLVVVTDTNRDRAHHWRSSQDVTGFTESGGDGSDVLVDDEADQRLPVFGEVADAADQTTAVLEDGSGEEIVVRASGYGEPFAYRPEDRPAMAVDGDPSTAWLVGDRFNPVGEFITVSATDGSLTLLQPQSRVASRMITQVLVTPEQAEPFGVVLDDSSLHGPGQRVELPDDGPVRITITAVGPRLGGVDTGATAVGFAELDVGTYTEVVRTPARSADAQVGDVPIAVVLTRERVDPLDRWRSDPEPRMVREFDLGSDRALDSTITLRRNDRAADELLDALAGTAGAVSDQRLTGDPNSRASFASDGNPDTAWTSPFTAVVGSSVRFPLGGESSDTLTVQQRVDAEHSLITAVHLLAGDVAVDIDVPAPDADGVSTIALPAELLAELDGTDELVLTVTGIQHATTIDRRFGEITTLPVSLREVTGAGIAPTNSVPVSGSGCRDDVLSVDGTPLAVGLSDNDLVALNAGESVDVTTCDGEPLDLAAGTHRIESAKGLDTGVDVDRIVLTDRVEPEAASAPASVQVERSRTGRTLTVDPCPAGCWLIMGEGWNQAWTASIDGESLGTPTPISGGFNGWWLPPSNSARVVDVAWTAQTPVTIAIVLSLLAVIGCIALVVLTWLRRRRDAEVDASPAIDSPTFSVPLLPRVPLTVALVLAVVLVAASAVLASPLLGALAIAPAIVVIVTRRPRLLAWGSVGLLMLVAGRIAAGQWRRGYPANAGWPGTWDRYHRPGVVIIVMLAVAALADPHERRDASVRRLGTESGGDEPRPEP